jgi:hypothetical protein
MALPGQGLARLESHVFHVNNAVAKDRTADGYVRLLYRYPALFAIHLTSTLMAGMGQTGSFDLYRHIRIALQRTVDPTTDEKEALWSAFRRAVLRLGLEVSPRTSGHHFMADTYLRQVGVPLAFADDLAEKMLGFAKTAGLPDGDDPEGIARWQSALESRLVPPFSLVAKKAVTLDTQGFYAGFFLKVHESGGASTDANPLERAMAKAFEKLKGESRFRRASLPYLAIHDGCLGVLVPAGESARIIDITVDGEHHRSPVGVDNEFLSITEPLPFIVSVRDGGTQQTMQYEVWGDDKSNRMLLFTETGRFKGRAQLGMADALVLPPGAYTALSRFRPEGMDVEEFSESPRLYKLSVSLRPGKEQTFSNGPAVLTLQGEERPLVVWMGQVRGTRELVEFHYGDLGLEIEFPVAWLSVSSGHFQVFLYSNTSSATAVVPVITDENGHTTVSITNASWQHSLPPGLSRLIAEIKRPGETRALLRTSVLFWNGLESVSSSLKFRLLSEPSNLVISQCENFSISKGLIQPKDDTSRHLSLTFRIDERRAQTLTWNAPGVFVEVIGGKADESEGRYRINRPLGSTESVSLTSSKQIIISASESGELSLGDWTQLVEFSRQPSKTLYASFLASHITAQSDTLTFKPCGTSVTLPLLKLVRPHYVHNLTDKVVEGQLVVKLESPNEIEAVRFKAIDIVSGQDIEVELEANASHWTNNRLGRARLMTLPGTAGSYTASVYISLELGKAGAWTFKFDGRIAGIWGHLQNQRFDHFSAGLICDKSGAQASLPTLIAALAALTDKESLAVFMRVQQQLLPCYSESSWVSMQWLYVAWRALGDKWRGQEAAGVAAFIDMACSRSPEDAPPSWMLQQHIGADLPFIFALPADDYKKVNENRHPLSKALRAIAQVQHGYPAVFGDLLHASAAMGFSNFAAITRGGAPREFLLERYGQGLRQTKDACEDSIRRETVGFVPIAGDYLGPIHYQYAEACLEAAYENSLGGNEIRRGQAIGLCFFLRKVMPTLNGSTLPRLKGTRALVEPWPQPRADSLEPEKAQKQENLQNILHFLSLFALHCRAGARSPESLQAFVAALKSAEQPVESCIAYLLQVGDAFFAYYLLLWEVVLTSEQPN